MNFRLALTAVALLASATILHAEEYTHKESSLTFRLPRGWTCKEEKGRLTIENKDKTVYCVGGVIPKENAKAIFQDIESFLDTLDGLDDVEVTDGPQKEKVNGLQQAWYEGTASVTGEDDEVEEIEWDMTIITGGKAVLFLVGVGKLDDNEKAYERLFQSIKKADTDKE